ncbi:hypothetical protein LSH36_325g03025 [Paralvinella palmiformis]|uniref:FLYWCH-type domain-containing protein n=1 Tax=Paralvinella palmiformis TaxID=53620 RepID=A0AAD9JGY6_9ANNE|nr:hypothetical protein LSH36_325g03025 [Paralvinella palmiformis]
MPPKHKMARTTQTRKQKHPARFLQSVHEPLQTRLQTSRKSHPRSRLGVPQARPMIHNELPDFNNLETANRISPEKPTHTVTAPEAGPKTLPLTTGLSGISPSVTASLVATITSQVVAQLRADRLAATNTSVALAGLSPTIEESSDSGEEEVSTNTMIAGTINGLISEKLVHAKRFHLVTRAMDDNMCNTRNSRPVYRQLVNGETPFPNWHRHNCVIGPVQIGIPHAESTRLDEDNNISVKQEPMDFDDFRQPNMPPQPQQNDRSVTPTSSIPDFSVDYPAPLRPSGNESSLADPEPAEVTVGANMVTYTIVEDTSLRGKDKLFDSRGYSYTMKRRNGQSTTWRCSQRSKNTNCGATVRQTGDLYIPGSREHIHPPRPRAEIAPSIVPVAKTVVQENRFKSASAILNELIRGNVPVREPCTSVSNIDTLTQCKLPLMKAKLQAPPKS